jgi:hypothetical protein
MTGDWGCQTACDGDLFCARLPAAPRSLAFVPLGIPQVPQPAPLFLYPPCIPTPRHVRPISMIKSSIYDYPTSYRADSWMLEGCVPRSTDLQTALDATPPPHELLYNVRNDSASSTYRSEHGLMSATSLPRKGWHHRLDSRRDTASLLLPSISAGGRSARGQR